jgi:hypothetical protein
MTVLVLCTGAILILLGMRQSSMKLIANAFSSHFDGYRHVSQHLLKILAQVLRLQTQPDTGGLTQMPVEHQSPFKRAACSVIVGYGVRANSCSCSCW